MKQAASNLVCNKNRKLNGNCVLCFLVLLTAPKLVVISVKGGVEHVYMKNVEGYKL